jgi:uncharacterized RDD family membrane protein YckC
MHIGVVMSPFSTPDADLERRLARRLLDVLIRATILFALALLCYRVLAPFLPLAIWALIFAVTSIPCTCGSPPVSVDAPDSPPLC